NTTVEPSATTLLTIIAPARPPALPMSEPRSASTRARSVVRPPPLSTPDASVIAVRTLPSGRDAPAALASDRRPPHARPGRDGGARGAAGAGARARGRRADRGRARHRQDDVRARRLPGARHQWPRDEPDVHDRAPLRGPLPGLAPRSLPAGRPRRRGPVAAGRLPLRRPRRVRRVAGGRRRRPSGWDGRGARAADARRRRRARGHDRARTGRGERRGPLT